MSDMASNLALFDKIVAIAGVDYEQASRLARDAGLIVRTPEGYHGVLTGVDWLGHPVIEVEQRSREWTHLRFTQVKATGFVWESA